MGRFHRHEDGTVHSHDHDGHHTHDRDHAHDNNDAHDVGDHGAYGASASARIEVLESIFAENDRIAAANRQQLRASGVHTVNVMSAPGAAKTTLLQRTIVALRDRWRGAVLEGDIATSIDADALRGLGADVALVNTSAGFGGECHLDAVMVRAGLQRLTLDDVDLLIVENVGNLVCPAEFDVGEDAKVMLASVTEGEDKPLKYPVMFRAADVVLVNKVDLLPHLDYDLDRFLANVQAVNPRAVVLQMSARTGDGVDAWCAWLDARLTDAHASRSAGASRP